MEDWAVSAETENSYLGGNHYAQGAIRCLSRRRGGVHRRRCVANDELIKMAQNPKDWVMPAGDYANTRYSKLNQITAANVGKLQVAWTLLDRRAARP